MCEGANDNENELVEVLIHREVGLGPRAEAELQAYADATRRLYAKPNTRGKAATAFHHTKRR